jgi:2-keto-4-pentenoate hydratase/2-oxohepta-3-ene-1,7-dioic acid hydratase in catechol pathway
MKIICIGRNYADHAKEMNAPVPEVPMFFMKPDVAVLRGNSDFYYPSFSKDIHYECELVVRIEKAGKHIDVQFAHKYYSEIGLGIDFTARDLQQICKEKGHPWEIAKSFEGSAPLSDHFLKVENLDMENLSFTLEKNGQQVQHGQIGDMIFSIDRLIAYVSQFMTLKTGDLLFTGTPQGVGPVAIGDELCGKIDEVEMFRFKIK